MEDYQIISFIISQERGSHRITGLEGPSKNTHGNTHTHSWTVHSSSVNLSSYHSSIFHNQFKQFIYHSSTVHLDKCPFIFHPWSIPDPSSCIHHQPTIHLPIIHSISILHQSIYHPYIPSASHPARHHNSIFPLTILLSLICPPFTSY